MGRDLTELVSVWNSKHITELCHTGSIQHNLYNRKLKTDILYIHSSFTDSMASWVYIIWVPTL